MNWVRPPLEVEKAELERVSQRLHIPLGHLYATRHDFAPVDADTWQNLEVLDSLPPRSVAEALRLARRGRDLVWSLLRGEEVCAPIILHREGHRPLLVSGKARMMLARALGIPVLALHLRNPQPLLPSSRESGF